MYANCHRTPFGRGRPTVAPTTVPDDNVIAGFSEGLSTAGWSVSSGSGTLSQASSSVRLTSTAAAVTSDFSLPGPSANDFLILLKLSAKYVSGQWAKIRLLAGATPVLDLALGYDYEAGAAALGTVSVYSNPNSSPNNIDTGRNYETTPIEVLLHIDRNYNCVNLMVREAGGKWDFRGSVVYNSAYSSLTVAQITTSAHSGQWLEYDWLGFAKLNMISIGDSINAGHPFFDPDPTVYAGEDNYNSTWQKHAVVYSNLRNNYIASKGVGGETSSQIHSRLAAFVLAHTPRLVFLHASTNDQVQGISYATRDSNVQTDINSILGIGAKCVLLNALYGTSGNSINPAHRDYMRTWWNVNRLTMTGLLQTINIQTAIDTGADYMQSGLAADGIHPNPSGYQLIGQSVATFNFG